MIIRNGIVGCILIATVAGALFAQGRGATGGSGLIPRWWWAWPGPPEPQRVARGKTEFGRACASCHAQNANGTSKGANLMRSTLVRHDATGSAIASVIQAGVSHKGVAPIPMTAAQAKDVVAFIQAAVVTYDRSAAAPPQNYPLEKLLVGDAGAGKAFFEGAGGCTKCHSTTGDLAGIGTRYPPIELQARFLMPRTRKPTIATVTLASGQRVSGRLQTINNFDVLVQDADGKTQKWAADSVKVELEDPLQGHRDLLPKYTDADVHNMFAYLVSLK